MFNARPSVPRSEVTRSLSAAAFSIAAAMPLSHASLGVTAPDDRALLERPIGETGPDEIRRALALSESVPLSVFLSFQNLRTTVA